MAAAAPAPPDTVVAPAGDVVRAVAATVSAGGRRIVHALLGRRAVLGVIGLLLLTAAVGLLVPQDAPVTYPLARALGLDHVFAGWWFRAIIAVAAAQLGLATARLARRDWRRVRRDRGPASRSSFIVVDGLSLAEALKRTGYVRLRVSPEAERHVKNVWGYTAAGLLHAGMLSAMLSMMFVSLTASSGVLTLTEGATVSSAAALEDARQGPLASEPLLSYAVHLDRIDISYWPKGEARRISGTYSIIRPGKTETLVVATNAPVAVDGLRLFQDSRVGYGYGLTVQRDGVTMTPRLVLPLPESADAPSYYDTELENGDLLRAKVVHDPTAPNGAPVLTLRLMRGDDIVGEQSFDSTGTAMLGDTSVSVDVATRWSILVLERTRGMGLLFASFFAILAGATLMYGASPRELTLVKHSDGTVTADWHAVRFARLYASEERLLREAASGAKEDTGD